MTGDVIAIVGGGITGLSAAWTLEKESPGSQVVILEASARVGGKLRTERIHGAQVEAGADSFLGRDTAALDLCDELGLRESLVGPAIFGGLVWTSTGPKRFPPGAVMGMPTSSKSALGAEALSPSGRLRAAIERLVPGPLTGPDISVADFVTKRYGREVLDRLVDPILAGTRAGDAEKMSLAAALPQIDSIARSNRSMMSGLGAGPGGPPPFFAPPAGMGALVDALVEGLEQATIKTECSVAAIGRSDDGRYELDTSAGRIEADGVIVAVASGPAREMLQSLSPGAAEALGRIAHASVAVITLVYEAGALSFPTGSSGFLVPRTEPRLLSAGTWWSLKWPLTTPDGISIVRCFAGRSGRDESLSKTDDELADAAAKELTELLGASGVPIERRVTRWDDGLPQYELGHLERIATIERDLADHPRLALAGCDYRGSGIPDCIRQGTAAAGRVAPGSR